LRSDRTKPRAGNIFTRQHHTISSDFSLQRNSLPVMEGNDLSQRPLLSVRGYERKMMDG
jgi:hypothetical protein